MPASLSSAFFLFLFFVRLVSTHCREDCDKVTVCCRSDGHVGDYIFFPLSVKLLVYTVLKEKNIFSGVLESSGAAYKASRNRCNDDGSGRQWR